MGNYDSVELLGPRREKALADIAEQISAWGLTMPAVEPLPLHFGLDEFETIGETEFWIANEKELGYCGKFLFLFDGQTCPHHYHKMKHETFFVMKGRIRMNAGEKQKIMSEGDLLAMPPGVAHSFTGIGPALVLEVSMPSVLRDNMFTDKRIGDDGVI